MVMSSIGQWNNETARMIYKMAGRAADSMVKAGKITAAERNVFWAKTVARNLMELNLQVPKAIAEQAGIETAKTAATSGTKAIIQEAGRSTASSATAAATSVSATQAAKGILRGGLPITLACFAIEGVVTAYKYSKGEINAKEAKRRTVKSAATNAGGLGGAAAGAAIGTTIFPGVGTAIGAILGGIGGALGGGKCIRTFTREAT